MQNKNSTQIRVKPDDKLKWNEYCKKLDTKSPALFSKILRSPKLELEKRINQEAEKDFFGRRK